MGKNVGPPKMWPLQTDAAKRLYEHMRNAKEYGLAPDLEWIYNGLRDVEIEASSGSRDAADRIGRAIG